MSLGTPDLAPSSDAASRRPAGEAEGAEAADLQAGDGPAQLPPLLRSLWSWSQALSEVLTERAGLPQAPPPPWEVSPAPAGPRPPPSLPRLSGRGGGALGVREAGHPLANHKLH